MGFKDCPGKVSSDRDKVGVLLLLGKEADSLDASTPSPFKLSTPASRHPVFLDSDTRRPASRLPSQVSDTFDLGLLYGRVLGYVFRARICDIQEVRQCTESYVILGTLSFADVC